MLNVNMLREETHPHSDTQPWDWGDTATDVSWQTEEMRKPGEETKLLPINTRETTTEEKSGPRTRGRRGFSDKDPPRLRAARHCPPRPAAAVIPWLAAPVGSGHGQTLPTTVR